ncbi:hypothetical protein CHARACLAT_031043 [Characodon lateralis]|uniref:Secreted protein n=1 Tax=Characodon lateralis TaxID=208331 RepID=A0ABU7DVU1_9TELE|nr:hypothetical protein [Characodon lateralis]
MPDLFTAWLRYSLSFEGDRSIVQSIICMICLILLQGSSAVTAPQGQRMNGEEPEEIWRCSRTTRTWVAEISVFVYIFHRLTQWSVWTTVEQQQEGVGDVESLCV